ncbi:MAG: histidine phosphatase family protein [Candidatus Saccharibacteria bacterium]
MITIFFESHSTTKDNEAGTAAGWYDVELSDLGRSQAKEMGSRYKGQSFDAIFCSDLQRSYKTAQLAFGNKYPIIQDVRLRECNYGDLNRAPKENIEAMKADAVEIPFPHGESYRDTSARMKAFLEDLRKSYDGKTVMIIGHRATQYGLEEHITGIELADVVTAPWQWQPGWKYELQGGESAR